MSICFMLNLFLGHKFLFLQFLLEYLFLLFNLLFWLRNNLRFFSWYPAMWRGEPMGG